MDPDSRLFILGLMAAIWCLVGLALVAFGLATRSLGWFCTGFILVTFAGGWAASALFDRHLAREPKLPDGE